MSRAIQAKTARERANIAAQRIRAGKTNGRAFDDCFEMGDGDAVVRSLLLKAQRDPRIMVFAERCGWTVPNYLPEVT